MHYCYVASHNKDYKQAIPATASSNHMERVFGQQSLVENIVRWLDTNDDRWALDVVLQHVKRTAIVFPRIDHVPLNDDAIVQLEAICRRSNGRCCRRWLRTLLPAVERSSELFRLLIKLLSVERLAFAQIVYLALSDTQRQTMALEASYEDDDLFDYIENVHALSLETVKFYWRCVCAERQRTEIVSDPDFLFTLVRAPFTTIEWLLADETFVRVQGQRPSNEELFTLALAGGRAATIEYYWRRLDQQERRDVPLDWPGWDSACPEPCETRI